MVTFVINRLTGEERIIDSYSDPTDATPKELADCLAKIIIKQGLLNKFNPAVKHEISCPQP